MNRLYINQDYCKGCLICVDVCPKQAIGASDRLNSKGYILPDEIDMSECSGCMLCEMVCPDFAIAVETDEEAYIHGGEA
ncbi:MAG: ferredoxin family protein [Deltaproteobacteria bacterium]|nr:ferredoxin family protein [Deltaproteobacteria bacterium]